MTLQFFWSRTASVWIALLYMLLGLPLLLFPSISGSVFVWALAAGAAAYAISHLWRYIQGRKTGQGSGGDLFLAVLPLAFSIFALSWPQAILSFLPLVLAAFHTKPPILIPLILSSLIPTVLGILLVVNPFPAARLVIMIFGATLVADGVSDLVTALMARKSSSNPETP